MPVAPRRPRASGGLTLGHGALWDTPQALLRVALSSHCFLRPGGAQPAGPPVPRRPTRPKPHTAVTVPPQASPAPPTRPAAEQRRVGGPCRLHPTSPSRSPPHSSPRGRRATHGGCAVRVTWCVNGQRGRAGTARHALARSVPYSNFKGLNAKLQTQHRAFSCGDSHTRTAPSVEEAPTACVSSSPPSSF